MRFVDVPDVMRVCTRCKKNLPIQSFAVQKRGKANRSSHCKECVKKYKTERKLGIQSQWDRVRRSPQQRAELFARGLKYCGKCRKELPLSHFQKCKTRTDGLQWYCQVCIAVSTKAWKLANPEHDKRRQAIRRRNRIAAGQCSMCKQSRLPHSNSYCLRHWFGAVSSNHFKTIKYGPQLQKIAESQGYTCAYTGVILVPGLNMTLDHILPKSKHPELAMSVENVQWVSENVNIAKSNLLPDEFLTVCRLVASRFPVGVPDVTSAAS